MKLIPFGVEPHFPISWLKDHPHGVFTCRDFDILDFDVFVEFDRGSIVGAWRPNMPPKQLITEKDLSISGSRPSVINRYGGSIKRLRHRTPRAHAHLG